MWLKILDIPVFNADHEVAKLYQKNKNIFTKFKKKLTKIYSFISNRKRKKFPTQF